MALPLIQPEGKSKVDLPKHLADYSSQVEQLRQLAEFCWQRGWLPAGSGGFSQVIDYQPFQMLTIVGNNCRGHLQPEDFAIVDEDANPTHHTSAKVSPETAFHIWLARQHQARVIIQTYSVWSSLLADRFGPLDGVLLEGHGLLQRLPGVETKTHAEWLPIVMFYDETPLIQAAERTMNDLPAETSRPPRAMVIQQQGMYTWAEDSATAQNQVELFEHFCEYLIRRASLG